MVAVVLDLISFTNGGSTANDAGTGSAGGGNGGYQGSDGGNATDNTGSGGVGHLHLIVGHG